MDIKEIKQDILDRYAMSWEGIKENMGLIDLAKKNFEKLIDELIDLCYDKGRTGL